VLLQLVATISPFVNTVWKNSNKIKKDNEHGKHVVSHKLMGYDRIELSIESILSSHGNNVSLPSMSSYKAEMIE